MNHFRIGKNQIGDDQPTYFIADIGANHDGELSRALSLIDLVAASGANAAKFQHFQAKSIVSDYGFRALGSQKSHQSKWVKSIFEVYRDASIDMRWTEKLVAHCEKVGIDFLTSPYDLQYVKRLDKFVDAFKVGSGEITWTKMLDIIGSRGKPVLLATGASDISEVEYAVSRLRSFRVPLALMQCTTSYTGSYDNFDFVNLRVLSTYRERFPDVVLGLSDHTPGFAAVLGAVALGARVIEKHFTDDRGRVGPDHSFSLEAPEWSQMVANTRLLERSLGDGVKRVEANETETLVLQRRSLRFRQDLPKGYKLRSGDLQALRPAPLDAISLSEEDEVLGRVLSRDVRAGDYLRRGDLST